MPQLLCQEFQETVSNFLMRHQSILDLLTKSQETNARANRAIAKAVTSCGCIKVMAEKKPLPPDASLDDLKYLLSSHLEGELCETCREVIINEIGKNLFYITALSDTLGISLQEILEQENKKVIALGRFNMT